MKTIVRFEGRVYVEQDNSNVKLTKFKCRCGNPVVAPLGSVILGINTDCSHCDDKLSHQGKVYPFRTHCQGLINSWKGLIEDETYIDLDGDEEDALISFFD